ncbi:MAG TPA: DUF1580 domain-containing protein [Planctomycetaceae bacterium]|nr:DUF1580 domain-containing protein [Planctomycetaceae bacterium]
MIDVLHEELIRIEDAAAHIPSRPSRASVWRWILRGVRGRQLESTMVGGRRFTSREAIERFLQPSCLVATHPTPSVRQRQALAAVNTLAKRGVCLQ